MASRASDLPLFLRARTTLVLTAKNRSDSVSLVAMSILMHFGVVPQNRAKSAYANLNLLGRSTAKFPDKPSAKILETFQNRYSKRDYWIRFECQEFTSMCPVTGQPDFAKIRIDYVPNERCIETKSLKFYLASFRNTRSFNEEVANRILDDLVTACAPRRVNVHGEFAARGGVSVTVDVSHPDQRSSVSAASNGIIR